MLIYSLIYTFETLKKEGIGEYEELRWFQSVSRTLKKNNMTLDQETLENIPSFELAQKSLDLPIDRALEALASQGAADEEE